MAGALMQIVAYGAQDVYLTGNPQITHFKVVYRRHTNFAMESMENNFTGALDFARMSSCTIDRNGDLITECYLKVILPEVVYTGDYQSFGDVEFAWVRRIGFAMIDYYKLTIGGSEINYQYGEWLNLWYELSHETGHELGIAKMIGDIPSLTNISTLSIECEDHRLLKPEYMLYVPLQFYFCRNNGLALPLIALQYHQTKVDVKFKPVQECFISSRAFRDSAYTQNLKLKDVALYVNYIMLDTEERRRFAQVSHEYLIEQLQYNNEDAIGSGLSTSTKITFNHPVKELVFVAQSSNFMGGEFMVYDPYDWENARQNAAKLLSLAKFDLDALGFFNIISGVSDGSTVLGLNGNAEYLGINPTDPQFSAAFTFDSVETYNCFAQSGRRIGVLDPRIDLLTRPGSIDYGRKVDSVIRICRRRCNLLFDDGEDADYFYPEIDRVVRNGIDMRDLSVPLDQFAIDNRNLFIRAKDVMVFQPENYGLLIDGTSSLIIEVELRLNGTVRQSKRYAQWYNTVETYQRHTQTPRDGIFVFSFALKPEIHQPTGTCNFSRIDTAILGLWFQNLCAGNQQFFNNNHVRIYGTNYNVLRVMSGMAGLAYSN